MRLRLIAYLLLCLFSAGAYAQPAQSEHLKLDSKRSTVDFEVKVLWLVGVRGRFPRVSGTITVDHFRDTVTVDAIIDARVVTMRNRSHEEWVKSAEFFDAKNFPEIRFIAEHIPLKRLQSGGPIEGTLILRGISRKVQLELVTPTCPGANNDNCPVEAQGSIRRSDFGMRSRHGTLADKVDLTFTIYAAAAADSAVH